MDGAATVATVAAVYAAAAISPGPNFLVITQQAISRSRWEGFAVAVGVVAGAGLWATASALGLGVILRHFPWLYGILKGVGGLYLVYLGWCVWREADRPLMLDRTLRAESNPWRSLRLGLATSLTNPQALIFFTSLFASVVPRDASAAVKAISIGVLLCVSLSWYGSVALCFSTDRVQTAYLRVKRYVDRGIGGFLALLGLRLALAAH